MYRSTLCVSNTNSFRAMASVFQTGAQIFCEHRRGYVWGQKEVQSFMNSILQGKLLGTVSVWLMPGQFMNQRQGYRHKHLGALGNSDAYARPSAMVIDGYNRMATLAWATTITPAPCEYSEQELAVWCNGQTLVLDAETKEFIWVDDDELNSGLLIPVQLLAPGEDCQLEAPGRKYIREMTKKVWRGYGPNSIKDFKRLCWEVAYAIQNAEATVCHYMQGTMDEVLATMNTQATAGIADDYANAYASSRKRF
ncbi:hypothetical protein HNP46_000415 [Pseudomonas nitritireducens]|uniref:DUF262 domain-containing protein n=1 Tax=Pseudomonas nitroreducens TaxID=46680 RepID=A0A7W7NZH4_PSENT|nr:hypothetical protein [Pseudomonas nitritireducens]MBB4861604.1 hypothetical protein [Pseudomonas nitritireducens]